MNNRVWRWSGNAPTFRPRALRNPATRAEAMSLILG